MLSCFPDSLTASRFSLTGIWATVDHGFLCISQDRICYTTLSISNDLKLTILLIDVTADVLSIFNSTCELLKPQQKNCRPNKTVLSSKILMCSLNSSRLNCPSVDLFSNDASN